MQTRRLKFELILQKIANWLIFPFAFIAIAVWFRFLRYRFPEFKKVRDQFESELSKSKDKPVIICANHLTLIDSLVINWAVIDFWNGIFNPSILFWHVPDIRTFFAFPWRQICYIGKCLFVERLGRKEENQRVIDKIKWLSQKKSRVIIFPEGKRSRTGFVDTIDFQYGVGELIRDVPDCHVLCVYMRSLGQKNFSAIPPQNQEIDFSFELIQPKTQFSGLRATRDLAGQVITKLDEMERGYFAQKGLHRK